MARPSRFITDSLLSAVKSEWATAMHRLLEKKEEIYMPFPVSVGNVELKSTLDWAAEPPPAYLERVGGTSRDWSPALMRSTEKDHRE
jgi:hypothetical protein